VSCVVCLNYAGINTRNGAVWAYNYPRYEFWREWLLVEEDIVIFELLIESVFHLLHARANSWQVTVPSQHDDGCIRLAQLRRDRRVVAILIRNRGMVRWF
jgi:hypothetical protein